MKQAWLISWLGKTDLRCSQGEADELGPVASALKAIRFDRVILLTNYSYVESNAYCEWLLLQTGCDPDLCEISLISPTHYADIYEKVCAEFTQLRLPRDDVELTYHLSPGTPAMAAIWIMLAKTRFPAKLIQTSREQGLEHVDFPFNLAADFLPEFQMRNDARLTRLSDANHISEFDAIVGKSTVLNQQKILAKRIALHDVPVLIQGETGTGKELFAEAIHRASRRRESKCVVVNCGAIPKDLADSELFGHVRGAFTGAVSARLGHFREANGGTLFLDEIGELPLSTQVKLLRVLQSREVTPVGASLPEKVDVRIIAATHRDLLKEVAEGRFREDLFHRLAVGILSLPPLRNRDGDLDVLIDHFMRLINDESRSNPEHQDKKISIEARNILVSRDWPGNVRELYHSLLRASIWSVGDTIHAEDVEACLLKYQSGKDTILDRNILQGFELEGVISEVARHYLRRGLDSAGGSKTRAAEMLGFANYQTLNNWLKKYGLDEASN